MLSPHSSFDPDTGRTTLIERDAELQAGELLMEAVSNGAGELLVFEGTAGIGKTILLREICERAKAQGLRVLTARAAECERSFSFSIVRQLLEQALATDGKGERGCLPSDDATNAHAILERCQARQGDLGEDEEPLLHGIFSLTRCMAKHGPPLIAVDDAQWMDPGSLRCLGYLVRRLSRLGVLVVLTTGPFASDLERGGLEDILCDPIAHKLRLQPLSEAAVADLIRDAASLEPDEAFCSSCHAACDGIPLFLRPILVELAAGRIQPIATDTDRALLIGFRSVARFTVARFSRLPPAAKALAETVAVLGEGVGYRRAAELAELEYAEVGAAASALIDAGVFEPASSLAFSQRLVRAAVHTHVDPARRDALHERTARMLARSGSPVAHVAGHLLAVEPKDDDWTVEILRKAAFDAVESGALVTAARYLRRALAESPSPETASSLLLALGNVEVHGGVSTGFERLSAAMDEDDDIQRGEAGLNLGRLLTLVGDPGQAIRVFESLEAGADALPPGLAERYQLSFAVAEHNELASVASGVQRLQRVAAEREAAPSADLLAMLALSSTARGERRTESVALARRAIELMPIDRRDTLTLCVAAIALTWNERLDLAQPLWERLAAAPRDHGSRLLCAAASAFQSHVAYRKGFIGKARSAATESLEAVLPDAWGSGSLSYPVAFLVDALIEQGELEAANRALADAALAARLPELWPCNLVLDGRGRLKLAQGHPSEALDDFLECGRRLKAWHVTNPVVIPWRSHAAHALVAVGAAPEGYELAQEELGLARAVGAPTAIGIALHAAGMARGVQGICLLREAVDVLTNSGAPLPLAYALTDLGCALSRNRRRRDARKPLAVAVDIATRCEATALAERAHDELLTTGARPRRLLLKGPAALTARERRIAALAADGMTNKRIATTMFLSEKTVELHLRNAYEKLDIEGRAGLAEALGPECRDLQLKT